MTLYSIVELVNVNLGLEKLIRSSSFLLHFQSVLSIQYKDTNWCKIELKRKSNNMNYRYVITFKFNDTLETTKYVFDS